MILPSRSAVSNDNKSSTYGVHQRTNKRLLIQCEHDYGRVLQSAHKYWVVILGLERSLTLLHSAQSW